MKHIVFAFAALISLLATSVVYAQSGDMAGSSPSVGAALAWSTGIIMAFASAFGTYSQSRAAAAALEGIARNPQAADKIQTPLILCLALMESLVIFALVIAFFLQGKIK